MLEVPVLELSCVVLVPLVDCTLVVVLTCGVVLSIKVEAGPGDVGHVNCGWYSPSPKHQVSGSPSLL